MIQPRLALLALLSAVALLCAAAAAAKGPPPHDSGALPTIRGTSTESRIEPLFSSAAGRLARKPVEVRCWSTKDWGRLSKEMRRYSGRDLSEADGFTTPPRRVSLSPNTCARLDLVAYEKTWPLRKASQDDLAEAIGVLTLNSQLLRGYGNLAVAECYGMQLIRTVSLRLGMTYPHASVLASRYWVDLYQRFPSAYRSPQCRDGGKLDLRPGTPVWP
jgi:hypothetical protein